MSEAFWSDLLASQGEHLALLIGLVAWLETLAFVGLAVPGVAILFALCALAGSQGQPLSELLLCGFAGAMIGDQTSFLLGRYAGPWLLQHWPLRRFSAWLPRGEQFFARHGGSSILIGRFVGPIRPIIPFVAGTFRMPLLRFSLYNLGSAALWAPAYLLPGYLTGQSARWLPLLEGPLLTIGVLLLSLLIAFQQIHLRLHPDAGLWRWLQRHQIAPRPAAAGLLLALAALGFLLSLGIQLSTQWQAQNEQLYTLLHQLGQQQPQLVALFTRAGDPALLLVLALLIGAGAQVWLGQKQAWGIPLGVALTLLLNHLLKEALQIPRPPAGALIHASYSFPSTHASALAAFYALVAIWLLHARPHRQRHLGYLLSALWILLLALSRTLVGVHWPLDLVAGVAEGLVVASVYRLWIERQPPRQMPALRPVLGLLLGGTGLYLLVVWIRG